MASDSRWSTSNQAYGSFWKAVPLEPKVLAVPVAERAHQEAAARHELLLQRLRAQNLRERPVEGDGNCQFRALSDQLYGSQEHHTAIRQQVLLQLRGEKERYRPFVPGRFEDYVRSMETDGTWGDHVTLQAAADALGLRIHVISDYMKEAYIEVLPHEVKSSKVLNLCFWAEAHYNLLEECRR
ncbi:unnamed protein product [Durusdinium trenchii]|uniref:OVARIAN TUMOR DOMAIN-containing deubiquitinating enzyme 9 (OTU domain-containing protein 9) (Deubiquitinating enzyme OTU9) n=2 Tax=Durusdinium trenchii TaxID=1381693 RepID=A0ABP0KB75_9DINO